MLRGRKVLIVAGALTAASGLTGVSLADDPQGHAAQGETTLTVSFPNFAVTGAPGGIVLARQAGAGGRVRISVSLHNLKPDTLYNVVQSDQPCSQNVDIADFGIWRWSLRTTDGGGTYVSRSVDAGGSLADATSLRIYESDAGDSLQRACYHLLGDPSMQIWFAFPRGPRLRGIVTARQIGRSTRLQMHLSLLGLQPDTRYRVVGNTKPCSQAVNGAAALVWQRAFKSTDEGQALTTGTVRRRRALRSSRSFRVYELGLRGGPRERACVAGTYDSGTGVLT